MTGMSCRRIQVRRDLGREETKDYNIKKVPSRKKSAGRQNPKSTSHFGGDRGSREEVHKAGGGTSRKNGM